RAVRVLSEVPGLRDVSCRVSRLRNDAGACGVAAWACGGGVQAECADRVDVAAGDWLRGGLLSALSSPRDVPVASGFGCGGLCGVGGCIGICGFQEPSGWVVLEAGSGARGKVRG